MKNKPVRKLLQGVMLWLLAVAISPLQASDLSPYPIGYLQLKSDPDYSRKRRFAQYLTQPIGRPYVGARVALKETKFHAMSAGLEMQLQRFKAADSADLINNVRQRHAEGMRFFIADLPAPVISELAAAVADLDLILFNIAARDDSLRQQQCQANLFHVIPSHAMLMDGLSQYLVERKWRKALILEGPEAADKQLTESFMRSAKRYGMKVVKRLPFAFGNDPRQRDKNNISLLTAVKEHDVIMVADTDGEFARDVPYQSRKPRLVIGTEGMAAVAWHWSWERHGAPQLEKRFEKVAKRPMKSRDWSAWMAVKVIAEAIQRTESANFSELRRFISSEDAVFDGFKGNRVNFRPWNNQMRQPVLLATHNWVVERAPIAGFLHKDNTLDTLGFDESETACQL